MNWKGTQLYFIVFFFATAVNCDVSFMDSKESFNSLSETFQKYLQITKTPDAVAIPGFRTFAQSTNSPGIAISDVMDYTGDWGEPDWESLWKNLTQCARDMIFTFVSIKELWAIQMFDADAKISSGILEGNIKWPGDYVECTRIYAPANETLLAGNFHGRYCTTQWTLTVSNMSIPLTTGLCIPSTCDAINIQYDFDALRGLIEKIPKLKQMASFLNFTSVACKPLTRELDDPAIVLIFILSIFMVLVIAGSSLTIFDYFKPQQKEHTQYEEQRDSWPHDSGDPSRNEKEGQSWSQNSDAAEKNISTNGDKVYNENSAYEDNGDTGDTGDKVVLTNGYSVNIRNEERIRSSDHLRTFLKCFCIFTNGSKILNTTVSEGQLPHIHGIRFFSMAWVILGHTYAFAAMNIIGNLYQTLRAIDNWPFQVILQGTFSVDSFFVLSGFLLAYLFLREMDKREGKMSFFYWLYFYIHRYWRLTPVYMLALGFDTVLTRYLASGPYWLDDGAETGCKETWWWNLLYINNFVDPTKQCFGWAWYLANDMQFYIISPIFLYTLWRWKVAGLSVIAILIGSSWIATGVITYEYNLLPGLSGLTDPANVLDFMIRMPEYFDKIYIKPYTRIGPYLIGVIVGYILYKTDNKKNFLKPWQQALGWSLSTSLVLIVMFSTYHSNPDITASSFSNALSRSTFAIGLAWVIFACQTGHGGIVNKILSYKLLIPLSRLTYCAYLVHPIVMSLLYLSYDQTLSFSHLLMVVLFFGFLVASYGIALITSLTFESPLMGIEKMVVKRM